jgi:hypothetical protein
MLIPYETELMLQPFMRLCKTTGFTGSLYWLILNYPAVHLTYNCASPIIKVHTEKVNRVNKKPTIEIIITVLPGFFTKRDAEAK